MPQDLPRTPSPFDVSTDDVAGDSLYGNESLTETLDEIYADLEQGGAPGGVTSIQAGNLIVVDSTDQASPVVGVDPDGSFGGGTWS